MATGRSPPGEAVDDRSTLATPDSREPTPSGSEAAQTGSPLARAAGWLRTPSGLTLLVILVFMAVGGYARLRDLGSVSVWADEAQSTIYAFSVLKHGYPIIVSTHLINNWEPLYPYMEGLSILVLGKSNFAFRLPSALLGIALIPLAFWVGAGIRDRYVGIALAAMVAFSTEYIAWSRQARWYILLVVLLALGLLVTLTWYRARSRRQRILCAVALGTLAVLAGLASIGVFLLYLPGILVAGLVYLALSRWEHVRRFFGRPTPPVTPSEFPAAWLVPYRFRAWVVVALLALGAALILLLQKPLGVAYTTVFTRIVGAPPYPLAWSGSFGPYLLEYYPGIIVLACVGAGFILLRRNPLEIALLALCGAAFVSVSVAASLTNGTTTALGAEMYQHSAYERHIFPLLFFLFVPAAIAIIELFQRSYRALVPRFRGVARFRRGTPVLFGVAMVVLLVLPGVVVPSTFTTYSHVQSSPADSLVAWFPFSLDPAYPSALYLTEQANYQLASEYVVTHRNASDVIAATSAGPPTVYCGSVQYWVNPMPVAAPIPNAAGQPTFFETGSVLVENTSQLEGLLFNTSGWLISDQPTPNPIGFPNGMNLVLTYFMTKILAGSDVSISLFHWNESNTTTLLRMLQSRGPGLGVLGTNLTVIADWAAIRGLTSTWYRDLLLPLESSILPLVGLSVLPLAILLSVFDHRSDLPAEFPQVLAQPSNYTGLIQWAYRVATGAIADPAGPILAPYAKWYQVHG